LGATGIELEIQGEKLRNNPSMIIITAVVNPDLEQFFRN
jgi:hypothetical protein